MGMRTDCSDRSAAADRLPNVMRSRSLMVKEDRNRLESYSQHYQLSINLSMSFLLLATLCGTIIAIRYRRQSWLWGIDVNFPNRWKKWPTIAGVLVCALIGLWRAYLFDDLFTRELVQAYLNNPLRWGHALNL